MTWINGRWIDTPMYGSGEGDYVEVGPQPYVPKHRGEPVTKYRVHYVERERGWYGEEWDTDFDTEAEAREKTAECNARNTSRTAPDYYIIANYVGPVVQ